MKENVVSHEKRKDGVVIWLVGFAILEQRNKRERELQAYEAMCLDDALWYVCYFWRWIFHYTQTV